MNAIRRYVAWRRRTKMRAWQLTHPYGAARQRSQAEMIAQAMQAQQAPALYGAPVQPSPAPPWAVAVHYDVQAGVRWAQARDGRWYPA